MCSHDVLGLCGIGSHGVYELFKCFVSFEKLCTKNPSKLSVIYMKHARVLLFIYLLLNFLQIV